MSNVWQDWIKVLKSAYGSAPPLLQSTIGTFANYIRQNYGKDVVGFDSTKTLGELPDIKLDKLGKLDLSTIDWGSLKTAVANTPYNDLLDQLVKSNLALPTFSDSVRDFLEKQNLKDAEGKPLEIGYDNKTRTVTLGGKTFLTQDKFMIKDQRSLSNLDTLNTALSDYLKTNINVKAGVPTPETEFSMMTPTELSDYITTTGYEGQIDFYNDTLKMLNDKESLITQRINDLWNPYIESATNSLDAAYQVKKSALESQKGQVSANYAGAIQGIEKAIMASRARTKEDMNARGLLFSGLLTRALSQVEAVGVEKKAEVYMKQAADLNAIASQLAVLTANLPIEKDALSQQLLFQKASQLFNLLSANDEQKNTVSQALAQTELNIKSLEKTAGARGEIAKREEAAATEATEWKRNLEVARYITVPMQNAQMDYEVGMTNAGISKDRLAHDIEEFDWTKEMDVADYNLDKWWREQQLAVDWAGIDASTAKSIKDATFADMLDPNDALALAKSLRPLLINPSTGEYLETTSLDPNLKNMYDLAVNFVALGQASRSMDTVKINELLYKVAENTKLDSTEQETLINNYFTDPIGKLAAEIVLKGQGDKEYIKQQFQENINNILAEVKASISDWKLGMQYLSKILFGNDSVWEKYFTPKASGEVP